MTDNLQREKLFIKISNNYGILPTVPKYIELNGLIIHIYIHHIIFYENIGVIGLYSHAVVLCKNLTHQWKGINVIQFL